jgi:hypothetical protein
VQQCDDSLPVDGREEFLHRKDRPGRAMAQYRGLPATARARHFPSLLGIVIPCALSVGAMRYAQLSHAHNLRWPTCPGHISHGGFAKESSVMLRSLSFTTVALALGVLTMPASAAPGSNLKGIEAGTGTSVTEQVGYRRCWWRNGQRRCRWVGDGYTYGPSISLGFGSERHGQRRHYRGNHY